MQDSPACVIMLCACIASYQGSSSCRKALHRKEPRYEAMLAVSGRNLHAYSMEGVVRV